MYLKSWEPVYGPNKEEDFPVGVKAKLECPVCHRGEELEMSLAKNMHASYFFHWFGDAFFIHIMECIGCGVRSAVVPAGDRKKLLYEAMDKIVKKRTL